MALQGHCIRVVESAKDIELLRELSAAASTARHIAYDFLIPSRLLRDPFQMNAATTAAMQKGNKFIQSIAFAIGNCVWIVTLRHEFLAALSQILGSATRKVFYFFSCSMEIETLA